MVFHSYGPPWAFAVIGVLSFAFRMVASAVILILPVWREAFPNPPDHLRRAPTWASAQVIPAARARVRAFVRRQMERLAPDRSRAPHQGGYGLACGAAY